MDANKKNSKTVKIKVGQGSKVWEHIIQGEYKHPIDENVTARTALSQLS